MCAAERSPVIRLDPADNIVVARRPVPAGTWIPSEGITAQSDIPLGHKISTRSIRKGEPVLKYNTVIGYASRDVEAGTHMHNDTIHFDAVAQDAPFCVDYRPVELVPPAQRRLPDFSAHRKYRNHTQWYPWNPPAFFPRSHNNQNGCHCRLAVRCLPLPFLLPAGRQIPCLPHGFPYPAQLDSTQSPMLPLFRPHCHGQKASNPAAKRQVCGYGR